FQSMAKDSGGSYEPCNLSHLFIKLAGIHLCFS
ncbi:hypothetical protein CEXT_443361, partial [Caerostris extrusa]